MMMGRIEGTNKSKSGKTIGVLVNGTWYTSKNWELEQKVGHEIVFEPSVSTFNNQTMQWINDYSEPGTASTPADQAFNQAYSETNPPPMGTPQVPAVPVYPQPPGPQPLPAPQAPTTAPIPPAPNKDAMIGAMALCKCCVAGTPEQVFENFVHLYHKLNGWDSSVPF